MYIRIFTKDTYTLLTLGIKEWFNFSIKEFIEELCGLTLLSF